jgi:hypothetical protein
VDPESLLLTHSEIAVAVAGFAGVAAVLQRPLLAVQRNRFYSILLLSLLQILGGLVPILLTNVGVSGAELWRISSVSYLAMATAMGIFLAGPTVKHGARAGRVINPVVTGAIYSLGAAAYAVLLANLLLIPAPGLRLYSPAMLAGLVSSFIVFADVATRDDSAGP